MKLSQIILGFVAGFVLATIIGLTLVLPQFHHAWEVNVDSDVHRTLEGAMQSIEESAARGDCETAAAQWRSLYKRFAEYRAGGPDPSQWWHDVVATTRPSNPSR